MTRIDLDQLTREIRETGAKKRPDHYRLFQVLKAELSRLGFWKARPRANPAKGYRVMMERKGDKSLNQ